MNLNVLRLLIYVFLVTAGFFSGAKGAYASGDCEVSFKSFDSNVLQHLPPEMQSRFADLKPKFRNRFSENFLRRDQIRAAREAEILIAKTFLSKGTNLQLVPYFKSRESRVQSISQLLSNRFEHAMAREQLTRHLLEIGYRDDSPNLQKWKAFRDRHFRGLESLKRFAINSASTSVFGLPLFLRPFQYQRFRLHQSLPGDRRGMTSPADLNQVESAIRQRIESHDPVLLREIKMEVAIEVARRIMAIGVIAILADEFLEFAYPQWVPIKKNVFSALSFDSGQNLESKEALESIAMNNWLDIAELLSGERPQPTSPEYLEIAARIKKMSQTELSAHVHQGTPLAEP